jgi:hypothetical protein
MLPSILEAQARMVTSNKRFQSPIAAVRAADRSTGERSKLSLVALLECWTQGRAGTSATSGESVRSM